MVLTPGIRLGDEIVDLLGAGGMGEVYRARDTRLNREVALKVLPAAMAGNAAAFARFEREAQAVFPLTDDRWQVSPDGGLQARWSGDGRTLYYLDLAGRLTRVAVPDSRPERVGRAETMFDLGIGPPSLLLEQYAVHGDGFLALRPSKDSAPQTIAVIGNWPSLLRQATASSPSR